MRLPLSFLTFLNLLIMKNERRNKLMLKAIKLKHLTSCEDDVLSALERHLGYCVKNVLRLPIFLIFERAEEAGSCHLSHLFGLVQKDVKNGLCGNDVLISVSARFIKWRHDYGFHFHGDYWECVSTCIYLARLLSGMDEMDDAKDYYAYASFLMKEAVEVFGDDGWRADFVEWKKEVSSFVPACEVP